LSGRHSLLFLSVFVFKLSSSTVVVKKTVLFYKNINKTRMALNPSTTIYREDPWTNNSMYIKSILSIGDTSVVSSCQNATQAAAAAPPDALVDPYTEHKNKHIKQ
jgi:hypothetical protein